MMPNAGYAVGAGIALAIVVSPLTVAGQSYSPDEGQTGANRAIGHLYGGSNLQIARLSTEVKGQAGQLLVAQIIRSSDNAKSQSLVRIMAPPSLRGAAVFVSRDASEASAYVYLPSIRATRRVSAVSLDRELLFGTDLLFADLDVPFKGNLTTESSSLARMDCGTSVWIRPEDEGTGGYDSILGCLQGVPPVFRWLEFYSDQKVDRRLELDSSSVREVGHRFVATRMTVENRQRGSVTKIDITFVAEIAQIPASILSVANLGRGSAERDRGIALKGSLDTYGSLRDSARSIGVAPGAVAHGY